MYKLVFTSGLLLYPLLTHLLIVINAEQYALMALMLLSAIGIFVTWLKKQSVSVSGVEIYLLVLIVGTVNLFTRSAQALSVPFIVVNLMLGVFVLKSFSRNSSTIFERMVVSLHGEPVHEEVSRKSRLFTAIWGCYFIAIALISMALAVFAPLSWWSWFSNVGYFVFTPVIILVMHLYQLAVFKKHGVAMHLGDFLAVLKMPLSDKRHPFSGFRER